MFLDFSRSEASPTEVKEAIIKNIDNINIYLIEPILPGITVDRVHFPLLFLNERAVIFRESALKGWIVDVREKFGTGGEALLYHIGFNMGYEIYESYSREDVRKYKRWTILCLMLYTAGFAEKMRVNVSENSVNVKVWNNIECSMGRQSKKPYGQLLRGIIGGFATEYFDRKVKVIENRCIAIGDPYCEFLVYT